MGKTVWKNKPDILKKGAFRKALEPVPLKTARQYGEILRQKILTAPHSGRRYSRKRGQGFSRSHQASKRGERFANDSGETLKSLKAKPTGEMSASLEFESKTADYLLEMNRVLISAKDEKEAQKLLDKNAAKALKGLM